MFILTSFRMPKRIAIVLGIFAVLSFAGYVVFWGYPKWRAKACLQKHVPLFLQEAERAATLDQRKQIIAKGLSVCIIPEPFKTLVDAMRVGYGRMINLSSRPLLRYRKQACPNMTTKDIGDIEKVHMYTHGKLLLKHCGGRFTDILAKKHRHEIIFAWAGAGSFLVAAMFSNFLTDMGISRTDAIHIARSVYLGAHVLDPKESFVWPTKKNPTRGGHYGADMLTIKIKKTAIFLGANYVCDLKNKGSRFACKQTGQPASHTIVPLYNQLQKAGTMEVNSNEYMLLLEKNTPFRVLAEVLRTATQAGFSIHRFVVGSTQDDNADNLGTVAVGVGVKKNEEVVRREGLNRYAVPHYADILFSIESDGLYIERIQRGGNVVVSQDDDEEEPTVARKKRALAYSPRQNNQLNLADIESRVVRLAQQFPDLVPIYLTFKPYIPYHEIIMTVNHLVSVMSEKTTRWQKFYVVLVVPER